MKSATIIPIQQLQRTDIDFHVERLDATAPELLCGVHTHQYFELVWIVEGDGKYEVDFKQYVIKPNSLCFIRPGQVHRFLLDDVQEVYSICFTDAFFAASESESDWISIAGLKAIFADRPVMPLQAAYVGDMRDVVGKLLKEFAARDEFRLLLLLKYFRILLIYLSRLWGGQQEQAPSPEAVVVRRFMELLEKRYRETKLVTAYASMLSVTPNYLNGIVKRSTGYPAGYHIRKRVILEAKRMGHYSEAGMKEIAYDLGFNDSGHFSKYFKSFCGTNFTTYMSQVYEKLAVGG
ncbi:helix-turn-helix domain-containing protein [Paraflavitalea sp. CAU 1676]|uniref:AraC family transcriptional regulator n=1 Tax=Paraflavitalea sp. CAU 1676 TaxID=3032598 RepID=UPI0023DBD0E3|nr:helix-turn-helix domain-containing protein [Paraflavitalea sp. CAU 1676]MDF2191625.1 helix-turn-helix transcriptional regulator [Paraflavitalea sp. CAU 1676]